MDPVFTSPLCCLSIFYAPINVKPGEGGGEGGEAGHRVGF